MPSEADTMSSLREELARLRAALLDERAKRRSLEILSTHSAIARTNLLTTAGLARVQVDDDLNTRHVANAFRVLGASDLGVPIESLFGTDEAAQYFEQIRYLIDQIPEWSAGAADRPWTLVYSASEAESHGLDQWVPQPRDAWVLKPGTALSKAAPAGVEFFLCSPQELVGPGDDFRVEYMACTSSDPRDLSVVVGGPLQAPLRAEHRTMRPEDVGYCFAFGCISNACTELQRSMLTVTTTEGVKVVPGRNHQCVAERVGGVLRFVVDGREAWRYLDPLPLLGKGRGHVLLYTCGPDHLFWDVKVFTRPTCIPREALDQIEEIRRPTLPTAGGRFVEAHLLHRNVFLFKDVTEAILARRKLAELGKRPSKRTGSSSVAAGLAGEMNQSLTVILGQIELLLKAVPGDLPPDVREGLQDLRDSSDRLAAIVRKPAALDPDAKRGRI